MLKYLSVKVLKLLRSSFIKFLVLFLSHTFQNSVKPEWDSLRLQAEMQSISQPVANDCFPLKSHLLIAVTL